MDNFNEKAKEIKNKASSSYDAVRENISNTYQETKEKADSLVDEISDTASELYKSGKDTLNQAEDYLADSVTLMSKVIRKRPFTSVLIATGIGYLFAKFIK